MKNLFARFRKDTKGATAIEYGLIAALISIVIIAATQGIGGSLSQGFGFIDTTLGTAIDGVAPAGG